MKVATVRAAAEVKTAVPSAAGRARGCSTRALPLFHGAMLVYVVSMIADYFI